MTYKHIPNRGTPIKLMGHNLLVYRNCIIWRDPHTGERIDVGASRCEAEKFFEQRAKDRLDSALAPLPEPEESVCEKPRAARPSREAVERRMYLRAYYYATARANRFGRELMTKDEFLLMVTRSKGRCELTGIPFRATPPPGARKAIWAPSIDRLDSSKGYTPQNSRLICVCVNIALNEFGQEVLMRVAKALAPSA